MQKQTQRVIVQFINNTLETIIDNKLSILKMRRKKQKTSESSTGKKKEAGTYPIKCEAKRHYLWFMGLQINEALITTAEIILADNKAESRTYQEVLELFT